MDEYCQKTLWYQNQTIGTRIRWRNSLSQNNLVQYCQNQSWRDYQECLPMPEKDQIQRPINQLAE